MKGRNTRRILAGIMVAVSLCAGSWAQDTVHVVQKGETLYGIAKASGLTLQEVLAANHLTGANGIRVGQKLVLPARNTSASPAPAASQAADSKPVPSPAWGEYQVRKGDTLYGIARQSGMDLKSLLKANGLTDKSSISVGQRLKVPADSALIAQAGPAASPVAQAKSSPQPTASPSSAASAGPANAGSEPGASESVNMGENVAQASEGTLLKTKPYALGSTLSWPHPGERLLVDGKLPGLLIKAVKGDPVKAVADGKVVYSGPHTTLGHIVFVQNQSGFIYIYGGNEDSSLKAGDAVKTGDPIGRVGLTPGFPEPEVYFSTWKDGAYIDPASAPRG